MAQNKVAHFYGPRCILDNATETFKYSSLNRSKASRSVSCNIISFHNSYGHGNNLPGLF